MVADGGGICCWDRSGLLIMVSWLPVPGYGRHFVLFLCPGCGLPLSLVDSLVALFVGFVCIGLMPLSYVYRGGVVRFSFALVAVCIYFAIVCWGIALFGNKFLIIQKKKIEKNNAKYVEQANRRRKYVEFEVGELVWVHLRKDTFPPGKFGKLKPRVDGPFKIIEKIGENAYKLQLPDEYEISPMFNVKVLRAYHGEDLRASLFFQLWGIDAGASINTPNIGNSFFFFFFFLDN